MAPAERTQPVKAESSNATSTVAETAAPSQAPSLKPVTEAVAQESARLGALAKSWWQQSAEGCQDAVEAARHEAEALNERTQAYVRDEPVKSMLMAAAAGAAITGLAMWLWRRR